MSPARAPADPWFHNELRVQGPRHQILAFRQKARYTAREWTKQLGPDGSPLLDASGFAIGKIREVETPLSFQNFIPALDEDMGAALRLWGCSTDACETVLAEPQPCSGDQGSILLYFFDTQDGAPEAVITEAFRQFPQLSFTLIWSNGKTTASYVWTVERVDRREEIRVVGVPLPANCLSSEEEDSAEEDADVF